MRSHLAAVGKLVRDYAGRAGLAGSTVEPDSPLLRTEDMTEEPFMSDNRKPTTTDAGIPVPSDEFSLTVGPDGPILLQDHYLIEQMANLDRKSVV